MLVNGLAHNFDFWKTTLQIFHSLFLISKREITNKEKNETVDKMDERKFYQHCLITLKKNKIDNLWRNGACAALQELCEQIEDFFSKQDQESESEKRTVQAKGNHLRGCFHR